MSAPSKLSPLQLAYWIAAAVFVTVCASLALIVASLWNHRAAGPESVWRTSMLDVVIAFCGPVLCGIAVTILAESNLRRGVRSGRWRDEELAALRTRLEDRRITVAAWAPIVLFTIFLVASQRWRDFSLFYCFFLPEAMLMRLKQLFTPVRPNLLQDRFGLRPIRSQHWGEGSVVGDGLGQ